MTLLIITSAILSVMIFGLGACQLSARYDRLMLAQFDTDRRRHPGKGNRTGNDLYM